MSDERTRTTGRADAPDGDSPFDATGRRGDRIVEWAIRIAAALAIGLVLYIGWSYYQDWRLSQTQSPAARAIANLRNSVGASPNSAILRVRFAEALLANGQRGEAIAQLDAALKIDPEFPSALSALGLIAMDQEEWPKAEGYWIKLIDILSKGEMAKNDQRLADAYYDLGTTLVELKRYEEAVTNLKESLRIKRDASPVHYMLSVAYARLGLPEQQQKELEIVVAFDPNLAQANYDLALLLLKKGDRATAAELLRIAVDRAPTGVELPQQELAKFGDAETHLALARSLKASDPKKALQEARIAAALDTMNADTVRLIAQLWDKTGDKTKAQNAWERLLELIPGDTEATAAIKRLNADVK
ncbi:MAG: tetratricopeptide repeat protein [Coriobacteriia bacterium]|nr:tetratricopeptide repeat protein [Coriobacteriia bacterium]